MKQIYLLLLFITGVSNSQNINIPDANFKAALLDHGLGVIGTAINVIDTDGDGEISVTEAQNYTGTIEVIRKNINDLTGIEEFININRLVCRNNNLTSLDISKNTELTELNISFNNLTSIDLSYNLKLKTFYSQLNSLSSIDVTKNIDLERLEVGQNFLPELDVSKNTNLWLLDFRENQISSINISNNILLRTLYVQNNQLQNLDLSTNTDLRTLSCDKNNLTQLDLSTNIKLNVLYCRDNSLTNLDVSKTALSRIFCERNQLQTLNVANGKNGTTTSSLALYQMWAHQNPNLSCIQHDVGFNPTTAANWKADDVSSWSTTCATASTNKLNVAEINISPNPVTDILNIQLNEPIEKVSVYNLLGKKLQSFSSNQLNVAQLKSGVYILKVETKNGKTTIKRIIKK